MHLPTNYMIVIFGSTGVGKSSFACDIAAKIDGEIINADMAQLYKPLSIGTAKPDWQKSVIPHHLFDVIDAPIDCTVIKYRTMVAEKVKEIKARGKIPIIVGGSGFYIHSLFFVPSGGAVDVPQDAENVSWEQLNQIDPVRAQAIHPNDTYRIARAIAIWRKTGKLPSQAVQKYVPLSTPCELVHCKRERDELNAMNNNRIREMIKNGWLDECKKLIKEGWEPFVRRKKFIGYCQLFDCVENKLSLDEALPIIEQKTRQYVKRQETFWRLFPASFKRIEQDAATITELNLTFNEQALYIKQLPEKLKNSITNKEIVV